MQIFTEDDIKDLRENPSDHVKLRVVDKLARTINYNELTPEERKIAEQILRLVAADISTRIRIAVSEKFASSQSIPYDVAVKLANDIENFVAIPMIQFSDILQEPDLLNVLEVSDPTRQSAVARRPSITKTISQAIIDKAEPEAVEVLLENDAATLSQEQTGLIMKRFRDNENVLRQMITTNHVNLEQAHDLITLVSEDLRKVIIVKYEIPASTVNNLIQSSREWVILSMLQAHADKTRKTIPSKQIIEKLYENKDLTFTIILKSLTYGDFEFFCAATSMISKIPESNIMSLIENGTEPAIEGLFRKTDFPISMVKPVTKLIEIVKIEKKKTTDIKTLENNILQELIKLSEQKQIENISHLITILAHYTKS